jgi:hypothetical protein
LLTLRSSLDKRFASLFSLGLPSNDAKSYPFQRRRYISKHFKELKSSSVHSTNGQA